MQTVTTVGLDIAKSVFQVHGVDAAGQVVIRRQLKRRQVLALRFVPTKTPEQQSCLMLHRTRHLFIRQQTAVINSIRAHLAEFGIVAPVGRKGVTELLHVVADPNDKRVPEVARACLAALGTQLLSSQGADFGVRSDDHGLASVQPDEQAPSLHSRGRSDAGDRSGRECCRPQDLPIRT